jgi:hypothetical protein
VVAACWPPRTVTECFVIRRRGRTGCRGREDAADRHGRFSGRCGWVPVLQSGYTDISSLSSRHSVIDWRQIWLRCFGASDVFCAASRGYSRRCSGMNAGHVCLEYCNRFTHQTHMNRPPTFGFASTCRQIAIPTHLRYRQGTWSALSFTWWTDAATPCQTDERDQRSLEIRLVARRDRIQRSRCRTVKKPELHSVRPSSGKGTESLPGALSTIALLCERSVITHHPHFSSQRDLALDPGTRAGSSLSYQSLRGMQ